MAIMLNTLPAFSPQHWTSSCRPESIEQFQAITWSFKICPLLDLHLKNSTLTRRSMHPECLPAVHCDAQNLISCSGHIAAIFLDLVMGGIHEDKEIDAFQPQRSFLLSSLISSTNISLSIR